MEVTSISTTKNVILEKENPALRALIGELVTDSNYDCDDIFEWMGEGDSNIQIDCSIWAQGVIEELIAFEKLSEESNYSVEDINLLNSLLDIMIKFEENNKNYPFIEYGE